MQKTTIKRIENLLCSFLYLVGWDFLLVGLGVLGDMELNTDDTYNMC